MFIKSCVFGAVLLTTPVCLLNVQEPPATPQDPAPAVTRQDPRAAAQLRAAQRQLELLRAELDGSKRDLADMRRQLNELLDAMDRRFVRMRARDRSYSCNSTRRRELMSHYQWLDRNRHADRAAKALAMIVEDAGKDVGRLNNLAWELMTEKETAGQFDRIALALVEQMERAAGRRERLRHNQLDTLALARFLNGQVDQAVALQEEAIARGGSSEEYRRRLRTYQAARTAIAAAAKRPGAAVEERYVAAREDDDE